MKFYLLINFLLVVNTSSFCQDWDETCEQATERASKDFANGEMKAISYGLPAFDESYDFEIFYDDFLKEHYNILSYSGGCMITESTECYSGRMYELILEEFGEDFFRRTRQEAIKLFKPKNDTNTTGFFVDHNEPESEVYYIVDTQPDYPGGFDELFKYVDLKIEEALPSYEKQEQRVFISLIVDKRGRTKNCKIVRGSDDKMDVLILEILQTLPKWKSGSNKGKKVDVQMIFPFSY